MVVGIDITLSTNSQKPETLDGPGLPKSLHEDGRRDEMHDSPGFGASRPLLHSGDLPLSSSMVVLAADQRRDMLDLSGLSLLLFVG